MAARQQVTGHLYLMAGEKMDALHWSPWQQWESQPSQTEHGVKKWGQKNEKMGSGKNGVRHEY